MNDRELLEAAAKAAGIKIDKSTTNGGGMGNTGFDMLGNAMLDCHEGIKWNPLTDDGDALKLAAKLKIPVCFDFEVPVNDDPMTVTRRAIVRAAAEMGRNLP